MRIINFLQRSLEGCKRVAIARAIVNRPKYLFCDEPNSGLEPNTATLIDNLIKEITEEYDITTVMHTI
jgi:phospholipid/cholesterol/gamma-HCH transport system ATP-binding protein